MNSGPKARLIQDHWKIIAYPKLKKFKLFDLVEDPQEMNDLSSKLEHKSKLDEMITLLESTMDQMDDPMTSLSKADFPRSNGSKTMAH